MLLAGMFSGMNLVNTKLAGMKIMPGPTVVQKEKQEWFSWQVPLACPGWHEFVNHAPAGGKRAARVTENDNFFNISATLMILLSLFNRNKGTVRRKCV
jgi:hypothetical protein